MNFHLQPKTKRKRKWTFIFGRKTKMKVTNIHLVTKSALRAPTIPRQFRFFAGGPCCHLSEISSCTVYRYICGIFLHDISTREQFAFLIYCYRVKAVFQKLRTILYWRLCGLTNSPIMLNTLSTEADVQHGAQKVLSNGF